MIACETAAVMKGHQRQAAQQQQQRQITHVAACRLLMHTASAGH
jgi:hypothetical protein